MSGFAPTTTTPPPFALSSAAAGCRHTHFKAEVDVHREEGQAGISCLARLKVRCADCGHPMRFPALAGATEAVAQLAP